MTDNRQKTGWRKAATLCLQCAMTLLVTFLSSCSTDYVNVIPKGSSALMSLDLAKMAEQSGMDDGERTALLKNVLGIDAPNECGIDLKQKVYAFETADGTLGVVAAVGSKSDLEKWIGLLAEKQKCSKPEEKKGFMFSVLHGNFIIGYSSDAILIMGPSVGSAQAELQRRMAKWLKADEDNGIKDSRLFERLETLDSPVALVAQAQALPDKFATFFTLGAPKGTTPTDVYVAATMNSNGKGQLEITGESFAFDPTTDKALKDASAAYKPISGRLVDRVPADAALTVTCGLNGETFIDQLRGNSGLRAMLAGLNTALDIDKMIKSIDGDVLVAMPQVGGRQSQFMVVAQTANADWLADVDYWKKSCPAGTAITDGRQPNTFILKSSESTIFFGHNGKELTLASNEQLANATNTKAPQSALPVTQGDVKGLKLCAVANMKVITGSDSKTSMMTDMLKPLFGKVYTVVFSMK